MRRRAEAAGFVRRAQPRGPAATITAVALAVTLAGLTPVATLSAKTPQNVGITELLESYDPDTGLVGHSWWQAAVALSTVETYAQTTGDTSDDTVVARAFAVYSRTNFENSSDDDTAWWALVWLQAYDITHVSSYLSMAETIADYIHQDWDGTCGGGVWWQRSPRSYKNAISNELFLELTAWLHSRIPDDVKYLGWAEAEWSWFESSGMINKEDLINDGLNDSCQNNAENTWTYNQGVILAGLAQLYQATGDRSLLNKAEHIATAAIGQLTVRGVLTEPCQGADCAARLDTNTRSFKGIFVRDLKVLAVTAGTTQFDPFFSKQAQSIEAHDTSGNHELGMFWAGPVADVSSATQSSAVDALVAEFKLP